MRPASGSALHAVEPSNGRTTDHDDVLDVRSSRRAAWLLAAIVLLAALLRWCAGQQTAFYDWDAGLFYARMADHLGAIWEGRGDSQYGARHPVYTMFGFPAASAALRAALGVSTAAAGEALTITAGLALVVLAARVGQRLFDRSAGLLAALLVALDPALVGASVTSWNIVPCAALTLGALALLLRCEERASRPAAALAGALAGAAVGVRADAAAVLLVLALRAVTSWRRGRLEGGCLVAGLAAALPLVALAVGLQWVIVARNDGASYAAHVHADLLFNAGDYPDAYHADETGLTLDIASSPRTPLEVWGARDLARHAAAVAAACAGALGGLLVVAAGLLLLGARREAAGWLLAFALTQLGATVVALGPPEDMPRYAVLARPALLTLAAAAVVALARSERLPRAFVAPAVVRPLLLGVIVLGATGAWPAARSLLEGRPSLRRRFQATADQLADLVPPGTRIARGPGCDTRVFALAGGRFVHLATGPTPARCMAYVRGNGLEWVAFSLRELRLLQGALPAYEIVEVARVELDPHDPQVLARMVPRAR